MGEEGETKSATPPPEIAGKEEKRKDDKQKGGQLKYFLAGVLFLTVLIAIVGGGFYMGRRQKAPLPSPPATPSPDEEITLPPGTTPLPAPKKTFSGGGILSFASYSGETPDDWTVSKESQGPDIERVYLDKDGYQISIMQGATGGVLCLYPGDPAFEGPSATYDTFVEIVGAGGELFRRGGADGSQVDWEGFTICQMRDNQFIAPTIFGHISYRAPKNYEEQVLAEMDAIVASLKGS